MKTSDSQVIKEHLKVNDALMRIKDFVKNKGSKTRFEDFIVELNDGKRGKLVSKKGDFDWIPALNQQHTKCFFEAIYIQLENPEETDDINIKLNRKYVKDKVLELIRTRDIKKIYHKDKVFWELSQT